MFKVEAVELVEQVVQAVMVLKVGLAVQVLLVKLLLMVV